MHVRIENITKIFGKLRANDNVSMVLEEGRIYAILGENGAGKSTLMKILSGYQPADSGQILLDGTPVQFSSPKEAIHSGIGMLHQDPLDVGSLTVLENFILGRPDGLIPDRRKARHELNTQCQRLGFNLRPSVFIDRLTIGERQQLEIVRLLSLGAKVLILDEPTTGISTEQKEMLFGSLKRLAKEEGLTVALVSHKLEDVEALCDEVYVLRSGKIVGNQKMPCPTSKLVELMFGQPLQKQEREQVDLADRNKILQTENLTVAGRRLTVRNVNLELRTGEVIGLAGLDGSGQQEFLRACAGLVDPKEGTISLADHPMAGKHYHTFRAAGVAYAPAGRLEEGLISGLTLAEHFALTEVGETWIDWKRVNAYTNSQISRFNIRGKATSEIQTLSGGNQQRTLLALLAAKLSLLLLEEPTRGLDVESARWVWSQLLARRTGGTAILFTSPDLDEIMEYSDRIMVFCDGHTTMVDDPRVINVDQLGLLIGGKSL